MRHQTRELDFDASLLDLDIDALLARLGELSEPEGLGFSRKRRSSLIEAGRKLISEKREQLCSVLGQIELVRNYVANPKTIGRVELCAGIIDGVAFVVGGACAATCCAVIAKQGIKEICPNLGIPHKH